MLTPGQTVQVTVVLPAVGTIMGRVFETESSYYADPSPLEAKWHIADRLGLPINSVERFKAGLASQTKDRA